MPQFEYVVLEQGGAKVGQFNDRIAQLVAQGFDCIGITGQSPHVSILLRRPAQAAQQPQATATQAAQPAQPTTQAAPRPAAPGSVSTTPPTTARPPASP